MKFSTRGRERIQLSVKGIILERKIISIWIETEILSKILNEKNSIIARKNPRGKNYLSVSIQSEIQYINLRGKIPDEILNEKYSTIAKMAVFKRKILPRGTCSML